MATNPDTTRHRHEAELAVATGQRYSLAQLVRSTRNPRRSQIVIRDIVPTQAMASSLYQRAYKPLIEAMTAALPAIVAAYDRGLPVNDALITDSTSEAQNQTESLGETLRRLVLAITPALNDWGVTLEKYHRRKWRGAVLSATGIDIDTILAASGTPQSVEQYISWNVALMQDIGAQAQQRLTQAIFAGYQARKPARDLAKDLQAIVGMSRRRALLIASDQTSKLAGALDRERMSEAGISKFRWAHSKKLHPREWHLARDGRLFDLKTGKEIGGEDQIEPGDWPSQAPYCGCRSRAVVTFD